MHANRFNIHFLTLKNFEKNSKLIFVNEQTENVKDCNEGIERCNGWEGHIFI